MIDFMVRSLIKDGDVKRIHEGKKGRFEHFGDLSWDEYVNKCKLLHGNLFDDEKTE